MNHPPVPEPRGGAHDRRPDGPPETPWGYWMPTHRDDGPPGPVLPAAGGQLGHRAGQVVLAVTVAVAALLAWGIAADTHGRETPTHPPAPTPTVPRPAPSAADFTAWLTGGGADTLDRIRADLTAISNPGSITDLAGPCTDLGQHATTADTQPAPTDPVGRTEWAQALTSLRAAAGDCQQAVRTGDRGLLCRAADELADATVHLSALDDRVTSAARQG